MARALTINTLKALAVTLLVTGLFIGSAMTLASFAGDGAEVAVAETQPAV